MQRYQKIKVIQSIYHHRFVHGGARALIIVTVFLVGLAVGNGWLQITFWSSAAKSENASLPRHLDYATVNQVYTALKQNYDGKLTATQLLNGLKAGLAESTNDPYTEYFTAAQAQAFTNELNNSFSGIGVELGKDASGNLIIVAPISESPASKAGLQAQDIIATINGQNTSGMSIDQAATVIRGPKNTQVTLGIVRHQSQTQTYSITRQDIHVPSVSSNILDGNIGYMHISTFADDTATLASKVATQFKVAHVKAIILDLRNNPGGRVDAAIDVCSLWLPSDKVIVREKGTIGDVTYTSSGNDFLYGIPTVVLINEGSASASEITAGALHDNAVARLIGTKSFGKGVVQQPINFNDGSELKVTVASWYRPNGQNVNKKGITPDQIVTLDSSTTSGNDSQLTAAEAALASQ